MQQKSLGLIETQGLTAGVVAADAAVKSANVDLVGYELTKGGGWTVIKIQGDVGAVKAAVDAAKVAAAKVSRVVSAHVIARPSLGLEGMIHTPDTVGDQRPASEKEPEPQNDPAPQEPVAEPEAQQASEDKQEQEEEEGPLPEAEEKKSSLKVVEEAPLPNIKAVMGPIQEEEKPSEAEPEAVQIEMDPTTEAPAPEATAKASAAKRKRKGKSKSDK